MWASAVSWGRISVVPPRIVKSANAKGRLPTEQSEADCSPFTMRYRNAQTLRQHWA